MKLLAGIALACAITFLAGLVLGLHLSHAPKPYEVRPITFKRMT